jgi:hypothetical protein
MHEDFSHAGKSYEWGGAKDFYSASVSGHVSGKFCTQNLY